MAWHPLFGYLLVQRVEAGKSQGGIELLDKDLDARWIVVEASSGFAVGGVLQPCTLQPGDIVAIEAMPFKRRSPTGEEVVGMAVHTRRLEGMPRDHYFVRILDCYGVSTPDRGAAH